MIKALPHMVICRIHVFFIRTNFIRTPRLRFAQKLRTSQEQSPGWNFNLVHRLRYTVHILLLELARSSGAGSLSDKYNLNMLMTFADAVLTVSCFPHTAGWNQSKHWFLIVIVHFYCSRQQMHCLEISRNMNNSRTIWGWNRQKINNNPGSAERYWSL